MQAFFACLSSFRGSWNALYFPKILSLSAKEKLKKAPSCWRRLQCAENPVRILFGEFGAQNAGAGAVLGGYYYSNGVG